MTYLISKINRILTAQEDVFKPPTDEEVEQRRQDYLFVLKPELKAQAQRRADGKYDFTGNVRLRWLLLGKLPQNFFGRVAGDFDCAANGLSSLVFAPEYVGGDFLCESNDLVNLVGAPKYVGGSFNCSDNCLISLVGAPKEIKGNFDYSVNELTNFIGSPRRVGGDYIGYNNPFKNYKGAPQVIGGDAYFGGPSAWYPSDLNNYCDVRGKIYINQ